MTRLFEMKDHIFRFWSEYETYLKYVCKFVIALALFCIINVAFGFSEEISSLPIALVLSVVCCLLPQGFTLFVAATLVLMNLYVLSLEAALITLIVFIVIFLLYFRFVPHDAILFAVTPICCAIGIPYIVPIAAGLLRKGNSVISVICSTIVFYFLEGVYQNVKTLQATVAGNELAGSKMSITTGQLLENNELYLMVAVFAISTLVVYNIRKMAIEHAWKIAIAVGIMIQVTGLLAGYIMLDITEKVIGMLLGNIVATAIGFVIEFLFMDLDYSRTERVQFEDDEYYYYVKAIPKKMVSTKEKTIKEFNGVPGFAQRMREKKAAGDKVTRKSIADELEIDEELLK